MSELEAASAVEQAEPVTPDAIMQLGLAFWGSKTLLSAVEMRLFAVLSNAGPLDAEQLRERPITPVRSRLRPIAVLKYSANDARWPARSVRIEPVWGTTTI